MKKIIPFSMMLFGLLWTGCTRQDMTINGGENDESASSFIAVSIVSAGSANTRAGNYQDSTYDKDYRDGETFENYVNDALFFFFYDNGSPAKVFKNSDKKVSYYYWNEPDNSGSNDHTQTVEKILGTTLQFKIANSDNLPSQILTVLNPTQNLLEKTEESDGLSLQELREIVEDYEGFDYDDGQKKLAPTTEKEAKKQGFVMSNSVYVNEGRTVYATNCKEHFKNNETEANDDPVTIYVERVLARIDLTIDIEDGITPNQKDFTIYPLNKEIEDAFNNATYDKTIQLFVRFLGWNVFDTPKKSRLIKDIDETWSNDGLFGDGDVEPWNAAIYHRSFWAINPDLKWSDIEGEGDYRYGPFVENKEVNDEDNDFSSGKWTVDHNNIPAEGKYSTAYFQENAAPLSNTNNGPEYPSKVIIAAQLVDQNGEPQELARWGMTTTTKDGLLNYFANSLNMWKKSGPNDTGNGATETTYTKISPKDLCFIKTDNSSHLVTLQFKNSDQEWYRQEEKSTTYNKIEAPGTYLRNIVGTDNISVWNNGYTYYYLRIRHLGKNGSEKPGEFGVVRNHIYDTHIRSVQGLGVPVYEKDSDIVKTEPTEQDWMLEAKVNILSWRVVRQDYDLTW